MSQRAKRSLSILAPSLNGTCGSSRLPHQRSERRRAVLLTMTLTAFGMPTVTPLIRDGPSDSRFRDQYARAHARQWGVTRPVGRPTGRRHADGARAFNNSRAHFTRGPMRICRVCVEPGRRWGGGSDRTT